VGILDNEGASLPSLFTPGIVGIVADLIKAIALLGPLDMLRRSRSSVSTRCRLLRGLAGTGRFVAAPGREGALEKLEALESFGLGGETTTGPPSFLLIIAHRSGRREEKLLIAR
jgi:hypothetical protein